jgi:hypothetical protein
MQLLCSIYFDWRSMVFKSRFYYSLFFVLNLFQNGCQFNMSRNVFLSCFLVSFHTCVFLEAGAKVQLLLICKCFFKVFLETFVLFSSNKPRFCRVSLTQYIKTFVVAGYLYHLCYLIQTFEYFFLMFYFGLKFIDSWETKIFFKLSFPRAGDIMPLAPNSI